jgi:tRNA threonylcarbamoyladenosine biosynthesis protein TsaE
MELVFSLKHIRDSAEHFWKACAGSWVFAFHAEMGAGKTTFIHALCDVIGVKSTVSSPTFSIINEYAYLENGKEMTLFHIDLYRLKNEEEAARAGVEDCLYSGQVCLVEWPVKAPGLFPPDTIAVYIELVDNETRRLRIAKN